MEIAILIWLVCGIAAAAVASGRGASGCLWFGLGMLFGPFGLAFSFASGSDRKCPRCQKYVHERATRCPHCQVELDRPIVNESGDFYVKPPVVESGDVGYTKCPDCAEQIRADARKCRFCGLVLPDRLSES